MKMKLAILIMLLAVFAMPAIADDVDTWIQDLNDTSPGVREAAAVALKELNDTRAIWPLIQALTDEDSYVRKNASIALGHLGDTRAVEPLIQALKDEDSTVRWYAAEALTKLGWQAP
jgi:HEAT repeat protein